MCVALSYLSLMVCQQAMRPQSSSVRCPGKRNAVVWVNSHSSSHWAATVSYYSSPHLQVGCVDVYKSCAVIASSVVMFSLFVCVCVCVEFTSFYNILKSCRGHNAEHSVFSDRTEESSAVQYFQVGHTHTHTSEF